MIRVKLTRDAVVRFEKDTVLEVSDREALRLFAFKIAERVEEPKKTTKKKEK